MQVLAEAAGTKLSVQLVRVVVVDEFGRGLLPKVNFLIRSKHFSPLQIFFFWVKTPPSTLFFTVSTRCSYYPRAERVQVQVQFQAVYFPKRVRMLFRKKTMVK